MNEEIIELFGQVREFAPDVEKTRSIDFVISSNAKDRHGTVLNMNNWKLDNYNRNGIVGYQHNVYGGDLCNPPDPDDVIGSGRAWIEKGQLIGSVKFEPADINPKAEKIFRKVLTGTLKATSVGFMPLADEKGEKGQYGRMDENGQLVDEETFYYFGQELLEFSVVNIPSNPEALRRNLRDQATNAIGFIYRQLKGEYRFSDIEEMTVRQVIDLLEGRKQPSKPEKDLITKKIKSRKQDDEDLILVTKSKLALVAE